MIPDSLTSTVTRPAVMVDVAIVGAGITGLRCALNLLEGGWGVTVLEARDRVGGRLWSPSVGPSGPRLDLGATWFWPREPRVRALMEELGLPTHPQYLEGDAVYEDPRGVQRLAGNPLDGPAGRFSTGAETVAETLAAGLPDGVVRTSCPVHRVALQGDRVQVQAGETVIQAASVVLALPPSLALASIDFDPAVPEPLASIAAETPVWMGATAKVVARYGEPFWRGRGLAGAAVSHRGPLREIHDMSGPDGEPAALFGFASSSAAPAASEGLSEARITEQLVRLFGPEAGEPESIQIADWSRERWTTPQRQESGPSSPRYDLYGHQLFQSPIHGRIHLASTETARAFAGHIEGALMAADETVSRVVSG